MSEFIDKYIEALDRKDFFYRTREEILERDQAIATAVLSGSTLDKVAFDYDLSRERVRQILFRLCSIANKGVLGKDPVMSIPRLKTLRANAPYYINAILKIKTTVYYKHHRK